VIIILWKRLLKQLQRKRLTLSLSSEFAVAGGMTSNWEKKGALDFFLSELITVQMFKL
jgi:hypothetical protein